MQWLVDIWEVLKAMVPQVETIRPDEKGVYVFFGRWVRTVPPGIYVTWPWCVRIDRVVVTPSVIDLRCQSVQTLDGTLIVVSGAVTYVVKDPEKALFGVHSYGAAIETASLLAIADYCREHTLKECAAMGASGGDLEKSVQQYARGWGIEVRRVGVTDVVPCRTYRILGEGVPDGGRSS